MNDKNLQKLIAAQELADAVQDFRNLKILGRFTKLRATKEYFNLCAAWEKFTYGSGGKDFFKTKRKKLFYNFSKN